MTIQRWIDAGDTNWPWAAVKPFSFNLKHDNGSITRSCEWRFSATAKEFYFNQHAKVTLHGFYPEYSPQDKLTTLSCTICWFQTFQHGAGLSITAQQFYIHTSWGYDAGQTETAKCIWLVVNETETEAVLTLKVLSHGDMGHMVQAWDCNPGGAERDGSLRSQESDMI